jgi:hypothetical protein
VVPAQSWYFPVFHFGHGQTNFVFSFVVYQAGRFRRLTGTMTPPDDSDTAEIYVEVCICRGPMFLEAV